MSIKEVLEELPRMSWEERQQLRTRLDSEDFRIGDASLSASQILDQPGSPFPLDVVTNLAGLEIMQRVLSGELPPLPGSAITRIYPVKASAGCAVGWFQNRPGCLRNGLCAVAHPWMSARTNRRDCVP
jgi:hypothetical protein